MNIKWIGLLSIVASVAAYGCSSNPAQTDFGLTGDDSGAGTSSGTSSDDSGNAGGSSSGTASSSNGASSGSNGGSNGASSGSNGGSSSGTASSGSGGGSSSGGSGGSSSGSNCTSDAGSDPDTDYCTKPVTLTMSPFQVAAGGEVYYQQTFANPWGKQVDIKTYQLDMSTGSHHMFAFYVTNATNGVNTNVPNGGVTFGPYTFTAQSPHVVSTYPLTVGATIPATTGFNISVHYLNTGSTTLTAAVSLTMSIAKAGVVTNHAGAIFLNQVQMSVPAIGCTTAPGCASTSSYTLPQDVNIMWAGSHMHKFATGFTATTSTGVTLFSTTEWAEPPAKTYSPPLHLAAGTVITWSCTDVNTTGATLTFGEHATTNVMCISSDGFYPVSDINNPVIGSQF